MSVSINRGKLCATFSGLLACAAVGAQEPPATESTQTPATEQAVAAPEAAPAVAAAEAAGDDIGEVIVTARRIQERLQDVPISITVFNQESLTDKNVLSGRDLATYTPSLAVNGRYGTENASFSLRGFSQEIRTAPSVAMYFADVVAPRGGGAGTPGGDGAGPGSFFDLQNVQVLKGPQGTLFGRNTTGGAILLVPQKPTANAEGYVEQSFGNYGYVRTQGVYNVPFSDTVRFRAGIDRNLRDGYLENTSGVGPEDFADVDYLAARASLVWDITPSVENYTIAAYSDSDTNGQVPRMFAYDAGLYPVIRNGQPVRDAEGNIVMARRGFSTLAEAQLATGGNDGRFDVQNDLADPSSATERWQLINTTAWLVSDALTIKNIISYAELTNDLNSDLFGTNFFAGTFPLISNPSLAPPGLHSTSQSTFTEEVQLQGTAVDGRLVWQAGVYHESSEGTDPSGSMSPSFINCTDVATLNCFDILAAGSGSPNPIGSVNWQVGTIEFQNLGVYTQSTFSITEKLKATGGIRFTKDEAKSDTEVALRYFPGPNSPVPGNYRTPVTYCINSSFNLSNPVASVHDCREKASQDSDAPTWVVGLDYQLMQDLMVYGKYARGYRQGAVQPFSPPGFKTYEPEQVDTYELGFKSSFYAPVRGTFNVSLFYNDFTDQQLVFGVAALDANSNSVAPGNAAIINAGSSTIYGTEVEATLVPFRGMNMSLSYAYLDTEVKELIAPTLPPDGLYNTARQQTFEGDPLPYSTKHKVALGANYTLPLDPSLGKITLGATYTYQSPQFIASARANPLYGTIPSYSLVNANLGWNGIGGSQVDAALFATNLLDKEYRAGITNSWSSFGFETEIPGEPRMVGVRMRVNFGA